MARPGHPEFTRLDVPDETIQFDADAFDRFIRTHGVKLQHWRAMKCPIGLTDKTDAMMQAHDHTTHDNCSNGYLYTYAGTISCMFTGNSAQPEFTDAGIVRNGTAQVTIPVTYDNSDEIIRLAQMDRFYLDEKEITVIHWQLAQYSTTGSDRMSFPAVQVFDLVDSLGRSFKQGIHFDVFQGRIVWRDSEERPGLDAETQSGRVYSVRYDYRPYWYFSRFLHEIRVGQKMDLDGKIMAFRLPQSGIIQREYVYESEKRGNSNALSLNSRLAPGEDVDGNEV